MLPGPIASERLETVARRHAEILQASDCVEIEQLPPGHPFNGPKPDHQAVIEKTFGVAALRPLAR